MGIGLRIFLVNDDDCLQPLAVDRYHRLIRRDSEECLPQYAGKRVRYALAVLDFKDRKPLEILQIHYAMLHFDTEGKIDADELEREWLLAVEILPPVIKEKFPRQVIDARQHFAQKRYEDKYRWTPTSGLEAAIVEAVLGNKGDKQKP